MFVDSTKLARPAILLTILLAFMSVHAAPPATRATIPALLAQLGNSDPTSRDQAVEALMRLTPDDLPTLREAVFAAGGIRPSVASTLQDIVGQIYLSEDADGKSVGFMGVKMASDSVAVHSEDDADPDESLGVLVEGRLPGFAAYRALRDGDLILAISFSRPAEVGRGPVIEEHRTRSFDEVKLLIGSMRGGETVRLTVLRGGKRVDADLKLGTRPEELAGINVDGYEAYRSHQFQKADAYWDAQFKPLIVPSVS